jgi:hypothetical protein
MHVERLPLYLEDGGQGPRTIESFEGESELMAQAARQTIANELFEQINSVLRDVEYHWDATSFDFRKLLRDAEKLTGADSYSASIAQALVYHLAGDIESASKWAKNAQAYKQNYMWATGTYALVHTNLGYFSRARELLLSVHATEWPLDRVSLFMLAGCWDAVEKRSQGDTEDAEDEWHGALATARRCNMTLGNIKLQEQHIAKVADLAGEVLQSRKMFFAGAHPVIRALDDGILYQLEVHVDAKTSAAMTEEVIIKMVEKNLDHEDFSFSFIPV